MMLPKFRIFVDGVEQKTIKEAAKAMNTDYYNARYRIQKRATVVNGHILDYKAREIVPKYKKMRGQQNRIRVYCETEDIYFNSITDAAKYADADGWTMSRKMADNEYFIDRKGRKYKRLAPLVTKNVYRKTAPGYLRPHYTRVGNTVTKIETEALEPSDVVVESTPTEKTTVPQVVKDALSEKIKNILQEAGVYDTILELLKYGGFTDGFKL